MDFSAVSREEIMKRVGRIDQVASIRRYVLDDGKGRGSRALEVHNGSGLVFTVYPDKGLDIGPAEYNGVALTWMTPNGAVAPAFYDASGVEWLRTWSAGLVTTCGLLNVGNPCETAEGPQGQHGRFDHIPAEEVNTRSYWNAEGRYVLEITGTIAQTRVFCEKLVTTRTIRTCLGSAEIEIIDRTENRGYETMPLMQLYHMNLGWPLVDAGTEICTADHDVVGRDAEANGGIPRWNLFEKPIHAFAEQVFYHDLPADADGMCDLKVRNSALGISLTVSFRKAELPYLVQWKMPGEGEYVLGIEPSNCHPEGQVANKEQGVLRYIKPGEAVETLLKVKLS